MKKSGSLLIFAASIGFILIAIVFSIVIDQTKSKNQTDLRAKAGVSGTINFTGLVDSYDEEKNILIVTDLKFADTQGESLGTWNVTLSEAEKFVPSSFPAGTKIKVTGKSATFAVDTHTLTALEITK